MVQSANMVTLKPKTLLAFEEYVRAAEEAMQPSLNGRGAFLWSDLNSNRGQQIRQGQIAAQLWAADAAVKVANGLIHDWIGAVFVPNATAQQALSLVQDYDNHQNIYKPDVLESRLISHDGDDFKIFLRLLKKKLITVVLDTDHDVHYAMLDAKRWSCRSITTRIAEVEDAGTPKEKVHEPDTGYGFLWRLYSYWRFDEKNDGVTLECRALSLTRDIPIGLGWIIEPIVRTLPQESLVHTLEATRKALVGS